MSNPATRIARLRLTRRACLGMLAAAAIAMTMAPERASAARAPDAPLVAAFTRELLTLDNFNSTSRDNEIISLLIDDALFYIDPQTKQPVPLIAASYAMPDPLTLDVTIRDDVTFHDGRPVEAADVAYTFQTLLKPGNTALKAGAFALWLASVETVSDKVVRFHMKQPNPLALHSLSTAGRVVPRGTYDDPDAPGGINAQAQANRMIGAGPYRVVSFLPGRELVIERYDGYRSDSPKGAPSVARMQFRIIPDPATQAAEVMAGGVHWTYGLPTDIVEEVASTGRAQAMSSPSMRIGYLIPDAAGRAGEHALRDPRVREALSLAIDRDLIVKQLVRGGGKPAYTPCLPAQFGCPQDVPQPHYDPARAKALLAEAGYASGLRLDLWASREKEPLEAVVEMWRSVGVNANLRLVKSPAMNKARDENSLNLYFENNGSVGIADVGAILPGQFGRGAPSDWHHDEALYPLVEGLLQTTDAQERLALARSAITRINEQTYWIPLYEFTQNFLLAPDLEYVQSDDGMPRLFLARWRQ
ncbi:ABC transporter substrate-binding protein [Verticiella sediminum]|uniref:ABC transporter substrate-binding protein n=1 Tax=Verticiella sediminum TaxID=1247510 RepID=A0A556AQ82_9BURK|nr:ABC transporter substrate-binding protein [Verticiella sediminum]TSH95074.1 ABC transporter substrate-binding protein [Verticiella sediminum]